MGLQIKTERALVSRKLFGAIFAVFALLLQPLVAVNVPSAFAVPVINEVMPNPVGITDAQGEWVEIHNQGTEVQIVSGWKVNDGGASNFTFPTPTTLEAGEYYVICRDMVTAGASCDAEWPGMRLGNNNTGDTLTLKDASANQIDTFTYPAGSVDAGASIEVVRQDNTQSLESNSTNTYGTSTNTGTPGAPNAAQPTATVMNETTGEYFTTIQAAIDDANTVNGDKILIKNGNYDANNINVTKGVEIAGESKSGTVLTVPNVSGTNGFNVLADGVTIRDMTIKGPADGTDYRAYAWGSTVTRGIFVYNGFDDFEISDNAIKGLRNNILIDGRNHNGLVTGNEIDNSKSGISVQYSDAGTGNTEGYTVTISGNTEGVFGNEWGLNSHLNGHYVGGSYHPNVPNSNSEKIAINAPLSVQAILLANSQANGGWTVQDQGYRYQNRTEVNVGGTNAADTNQGSPLGQLATLQTAIDAAVTGGVIEVNSNLSLSQQATITRAVTMNGNGKTITGSFVKNSNSNNSVIGVQGSSVTISNLTVDVVDVATNMLHGINVYEADDVTLTDIVALNGRSGVVVGQGSTVAIDGIETDGNIWHGINVDKPGSHLTISGNNSHGEVRPIFVDNKTVGTVVDDDNQYSEFENGNTLTYLLSSELSDGSGGTVTLPATGGVATTPTNHPVELVLGDTTVIIPEGTTVTASDSTWDGTILAPESVTYVVPGGFETGLALKVGSNDITLTFDKAVMLVLPGQAGKRVGFVPAGSSTFTEITSNCSIYLPDLNANMPAAGDCKTTDGNDLVIWTKHFTTFVAYSETSGTSGSNQMQTLSPIPAETTARVVTVSYNTTPEDVVEVNRGDILGSAIAKNTAKTPVAAVEPSDEGWKIWGLAWYWWVIINAALIALIWGGITWYRGRSQV